MKITFYTTQTESWGDKQQEMHLELRRLLDSGKDFSVELRYLKPIKDPKLPNIFFFRQHNRENLMEVRKSAGQEITRRMTDQNFDDFKIIFAPASMPSDEQRAYYFGVILPTIQEYFKAEGKYISITNLDSDIRGVISEEFGLFKEEVNSITGEVEKRQITLSNAGNKQDVRKYIDAVILWAARDYSIDIPAPPEK